MRRKLTDVEKKACRVGINNRYNRIAELKTELSYFREFNAFNDKWAKYLEDKDKKQKARKKIVIKETLTQLEQSLEHEQKSMDTEKDQLINGVEVKVPSGIN